MNNTLDYFAVNGEYKMLVTDISLCQFYRKLVNGQRIKLCMDHLLIARHADAKEMYEKLEQDWTSIDNLTNDKILFVFSTNLISNSNSFFHTPGRESYVGRMCPFAEMLNGEDIRDNYGDLWNLYDNFDKVDWKQKTFIGNYRIRKGIWYIRRTASGNFCMEFTNESI